MSTRESEHETNQEGEEERLPESREKDAGKRDEDHLAGSDYRGAESPAPKHQGPFRFFFEVPWKALGVSWVQAASLVAFCVAVALITNWIRWPHHGGLAWRRKRPFDLYTDCPEIMDNIPTVKVEKLPKASNKSKGVLYVDARKGLAYCKGHIPGALFLPMFETDPPDPKIVARLKSLRGRWFVVYGDESVSSAKRLATALINKKVRGIKLLEGNLKAWKKADRKLQTCMAEEIGLNDLPKEEKRVVFVDARSEDDYNAARLPGALFIPYDDLLPPDPKVLAKLPAPVKKRKKKAEGKLIVVYDSGTPAEEGEIAHRAAGTAALLKARRYPNVKVLKGGIEAWKNARKPLETGAKAQGEEG